MNIRDSTFQLQLDAIAKSGEKEVHWYYDVDILIEGKTYKPFKLFTIDISRKYSGAYADHIIVDVMLTFSTYTNYIYPNKDNILITLYRKPLDEQGDTKEGTKVDAQVYRGLILPGNDPQMSPKVELPTNDAALDVGNPIRLQFQLVPRNTEKLRLITWGTTHHGKHPGAYLKDIFTLLSKDLKVDEAHEVPGVQMATPDNLTPRDNTVIPHLTPMLDLPDLLQDKLGGIYNGGIDYYLQGNMWYIWPRYGLTRYGKERLPTLTIFNVPENAYPGIERTYKVEPGQVIIISTGESNDIDVSEKVQLNLGNGVRQTDANAILSGGMVIEDGKNVASRGASNMEFVDEQRRSGLNYAPASADRISANQYKAAAQVAAMKGIVQRVTWENCDTELLYPGMPCRIYYLKNGEVTERRGQLIDAHYYIVPENPMGVTFVQHNATGVLSLFVSKAPHDPHATL